MQYRMITIAAGILIFGLVASNASANDMKIGYVDMRSAIENTTSFKEGMHRLKSSIERQNKELKALVEKIQKVQSDLEGKAMVIKPERLAARQEEISELQKQHTRKQQDARDALTREKQRLDAGATENFRQAVQEYAEKNHYDLILRKQIMLHGSQKYDITAEITKMMDKKK